MGKNTNILFHTHVKQVSEDAVLTMQQACGAGIIIGTGDGSTLSPYGTAIRAGSDAVPRAGLNAVSQQIAPSVRADAGGAFGGLSEQSKLSKHCRL